MGGEGFCHLKSVRELLEESFLNLCVEKLFTEHGIGFLSDAALLHKEWSRSVHLVSLNTKEEDDPVLWSYCYRYKQFNELICYRFFWRLPNFPIFSQSAGNAMQASGHLHVTKLKLIHWILHNLFSLSLGLRHGLPENFFRIEIVYFLFTKLRPSTWPTLDTPPTTTSCFRESSYCSWQLAGWLAALCRPLRAARHL